MSAPTSPVTWRAGPARSATAVRELAGADGEALEEAGGDVGDADADHLPVAVDLLAAGARRRGRGRDRVGQGHERDADAPDHEQGEVVPAHRREREGSACPGASGPDDLDAASREVEGDAQPRWRRRQPRATAGTLGRMRPRTRMRASENSPIAAAAATTSPSAMPWSTPTASPMNPSASTEKPEQLGQLPHEDGQGQAVDVAEDRRPGEQVGDEAELAHAPRRP